MKRFLIVLTVTLVTARAFSQTTEDSVKAVITKMFAAMKAADAESLSQCFGDSMILQTILPGKEGLLVRNEPAADFIDFIRKETPGNADERIRFTSILIDGPLASVWTPYEFYYKGSFHHCGVNSFQCVRFADGWKIQYIIDTRRKAGCK